MDILSFISGAAIALYAMIGGAFLSASITSPMNARKVLERLIPAAMVHFIEVGIAYAVGAVAVWYFSLEVSSLLHNPFLYLIAAHIALFVLFSVCWQLVSWLLEDDPEEPQDSQ